MDQNPTPAPEAPGAQPTPTFDGAAQSSDDSTGTQPAQTAKKGLAIAALICGICGLCLCFVGCLGLILAITGVVLGIMALIKKQNKGMAIAGLACGGVGLIPGAIFTVLMIMALGIVGVASTIANDYNSYLSDSVEYCNTYPDSSYCTIEYDYDYDWDWDDDEDDDYDWDWDDEEDDDDENTILWMDDFVDELFAEEEGGNLVNDDVKDQFNKVLTDYVICLNDNGVEIDSADDFSAIFDGDITAITEAELTTTQASNIAECSSDLTDAMSEFDY